MKNRVYQVTEYTSFSCNKNIEGYISLDEETFNQLKDFILYNNAENIELLSLGARKNIGQTITCKNYVGLISLKNGVSIEILPKIISQSILDKNENRTQAKQLLVDMIKTIYNISYKLSSSANVNIAKMDIFDIFIEIFILQVQKLVKNGIKCDYNTIQENSNYIKGKIIFSQQIKHNLIHQEHNYIEYDQYLSNCTENSIIKSTLLYLYSKTLSFNIKSQIRKLLTFFDNVVPSINYTKDINSIVFNRGNDRYYNAISWAKIFLMGKSFCSFYGSNLAFAVLFPMEQLFEKYVAKLIKKNIPNGKVNIQENLLYLFSNPNKFKLKPDIVVRTNGNIYILDTKWKILNTNANYNYGISQNDIYQMYAYHKKYNARNVTLIFPYFNGAKNFALKDEVDNVEINVVFVDLFNINNSIQDLLNYTIK